MDNFNVGPAYPTCDHIRRQKITDIPISKELSGALTNEADVLPLYEDKIYKYKLKKNCSLVDNEKLKCRVIEFVERKMRGGKEKVAFRFPSVNDYHFCFHAVKYKPSESTSNHIYNRFHMKPGPGVDKLGQLPIPDDMHLRKTVYIPPTNTKNTKISKSHRKKKSTL